MNTHVHGEGEVKAILCPNRYRKLYADPVQFVSEIQEQAKEMMKQEFPDKNPLGIGLCTCWEPILMWELDS